MPFRFGKALGLGRVSYAVPASAPDHGEAVIGARQSQNTKLARLLKQYNVVIIDVGFEWLISHVF